MKNIMHDTLPWLPTSPQVVHKLEQAVFPGASHKVKSFSMEDRKLIHLTKPTARNILAYSWSCEKAGAFLTKSEKGSHSYRLTTPSSHVFVQVGHTNTISMESTSYHLLSMKSMISCRYSVNWPIHTWYLSRTPRIYSCKFFGPV